MKGFGRGSREMEECAAIVRGWDSKKACSGVDGSGGQREAHIIE